MARKTTLPDHNVWAFRRSAVGDLVATGWRSVRIVASDDRHTAGLARASPHGNLVGMATTTLLTEGDLDRGRAPEATNPHWRCGIVDPATGAVCTRRPHSDEEQHQGWEAVQGAGRSTRVVGWTGGSERAMVVDTRGLACLALTSSYVPLQTGL